MFAGNARWTVIAPGRLNHKSAVGDARRRVRMTDNHDDPTLPPSGIGAALSA
jgi:hypothetical protein